MWQRQWRSSLAQRQWPSTFPVGRSLSPRGPRSTGLTKPWTYGTSVNDQDRTTSVNLLMTEYSTLRAEILQRVQTRYQLLGFVGVAAGLVLTKSMPGWLVCVVGGIALGVAALTWWLLAGSIRSCAVQLRHVEHAVDAEFNCDTIPSLAELGQADVRRTFLPSINRPLTWEIRQNPRRERIQY